MKRDITYLILLVGFTCAQAAPAYLFDAQPKQVAIQSQCIMTTGAAYSSTVYEPFDQTPPSEYNSNTTEESSGPAHHGGLRRLGGGTDPGEPASIGDPWIMLLFASALAAILAWRKRKGKALS